MMSENMISLFVDRGFDISFKSSDDSTLQIVKYGEYLYDHIIVFAPTTKGKIIFLCFLCKMMCFKNLVDVWIQKF
jgi:hypothetical protein